MFDLIVGLLSLILGVSSSLIYEVFSFILNKKSENQEADITPRIKQVSKVLENSVQEINELQNELEKKIKLVEKLQQEAEDAENIIMLTEDQVKAVKTTLNDELRKEGQKSFWQGVIVNFIFFVLGAIVSYIVSKYLV